MQPLLSQLFKQASLLKQLSAVCVLLLLSACGSKTPQISTGPLYQDNLSLFTYGAHDKALEKKLRVIHGRQLAESAHYLLEQNNKTLFNQVYQVKATPYSANSHCQGCNSEQTALAMLNNKVLPELVKALQSH